MRYWVWSSVLLLDVLAASPLLVTAAWMVIGRVKGLGR